MRSTANLILETKSRDQKIAKQIDNFRDRLKKLTTDASKAKAKRIETFSGNSDAVVKRYGTG